MSRMNLLARSRSTSRRTVCFALLAGFMTTGVSADTLAQPKDNTLERHAASYIQFREDVAALEATPFDNANTTREAHRRLSAHDSKELSSGWVAYAALVAADTPEFAEAIRKEVKRSRSSGKLGGVEGLLSNLAQDPSYARKLKGANKASDAVLAMTARDSARIDALGEAFKAQAYALQKTNWGKARISPAQDRLNEAAAYSRKRGAPNAPRLELASNGGVVEPSLASASGEWSAEWGEAGGKGRMTEANAQVIMDRVLNLAARYATGSLNSKVVEVYARNDKSDRCLSMAKLTLDQCIAATRTPYEEAFCLGEHGLKDVATCTGWVAGAGAS